MEDMNQVNQRYRELCTMLGDITVKQKGLQNQQDSIFSELNKLDQVAAEFIKREEDKQKEIARREIARHEESNED